VERARAASGFQLTEDSAAAVAEVCRQVEGMPLAIELAAGRTGVLTPGQIADRLREPLRVLIGGSRTAPERQPARNCWAPAWTTYGMPMR
jgi:predicted ATPase